jgi:hypothetical protein
MMFDDANHDLLVVGTPTDGFRLWCKKCDRTGDQVYDDYWRAQRAAVATRKDIAPRCLDKLQRGA